MAQECVPKPNKGEGVADDLDANFDVECRCADAEASIQDLTPEQTKLQRGSRHFWEDVSYSWTIVLQAKGVS